MFNILINILIYGIYTTNIVNKLSIRLLTFTKLYNLKQKYELLISNNKDFYFKKINIY
jgi:hypothetical protein